MPQDSQKAYLDKLVSSISLQHPDTTKTDVSSAVNNYRNLSPKIEPFVFNDGSKRSLLCLDGTIPVRYKGNVYNIPICIWILETHPYSSPICYVKPTSEMEIKTSCHVDSNGRIFLPYLHNWHPKKSDLLGLIQVMILKFGDAPPLYTRRIVAAPQTTNPPYPTTGYSIPVPSPYNPPYPTPAPPTGGYPYPAASYPQPGYPQPGYPSYTANSEYPQPTTTNFTNYTPAFSSATNQQQQQQTGTISEEHIHASLLSAVEDKMKKRLREVLAQSEAEMEALKRTHDDLNLGKQKLEDIISSLQNEQTSMEKNVMFLREKIDDMKDLISRLEKADSIDLDEAVVTTAPLYKQLLNAHAEENATEDAIYYLGESLRKGVIDLDLFLKHVRQLSRKQFMLRALMQKTRQKAGLPC